MQTDKTYTITDLPLELQLAIASRLNRQDMRHFCATAKMFHTLAFREHLDRLNVEQGYVFDVIPKFANGATTAKILMLFTNLFPRIPEKDQSRLLKSFSIYAPKIWDRLQKKGNWRGCRPSLILWLELEKTGLRSATPISDLAKTLLPWVGRKPASFRNFLKLLLKYDSSLKGKITHLVLSMFKKLFLSSTPKTDYFSDRTFKLVKKFRDEEVFHQFIIHHKMLHGTTDELSAALMNSSDFHIGHLTPMMTQKDCLPELLPALRDKAPPKRFESLMFHFYHNECLKSFQCCLSLLPEEIKLLVLCLLNEAITISRDQPVMTPFLSFKCIDTYLPLVYALKFCKWSRAFDTLDCIDDPNKRDQAVDRIIWEILEKDDLDALPILSRINRYLSERQEPTRRLLESCLVVRSTLSLEVIHQLKSRQDPDTFYSLFVPLWLSKNIKCIRFFRDVHDSLLFEIEDPKAFDKALFKTLEICISGKTNSDTYPVPQEVRREIVKDHYFKCTDESRFLLRLVDHADECLPESAAMTSNLRVDFTPEGDS